MQIGTFDVELASDETTCDVCHGPAILAVNEQPLCAADAGVHFGQDPAVLGLLVAGFLHSVGAQ